MDIERLADIERLVDTKGPAEAEKLVVIYYKHQY